MNILAISGSLKASSTNTQLLHNVASLVPGVPISLYDRLVDLPHFSPDLDAEPPASVLELREALAAADAVIICTPEYAYGMPGSLKNLLDWTVSSGEFLNKPVAAMSASANAGGAARARQSLLTTLTALSANVVEDAGLIVPSIKSKLTADGQLSDESLREALKRAVEALIRTAQGSTEGSS